jgi:uncharacterized protein (TIGR03118 family)
MRNASRALRLLAAGCVFAVVPFATFAQHYTQTNLVSNVPAEFPNGSNGPAVINDPSLQNPWGLVASPGSPWWVSNNADGTSTLYNALGAPVNLNAGNPGLNGVPVPQNGILVPNAPSQPAPGSPTGIVFNGTATDFLLAPGAHAIFIFVTEDGTVSGWNPGVNPLTAVIKVDNSQKPNAKNGAVYKGSTIDEINGKHFLLAANFRSGRIDVFDSSFNQVRLSEDAFDDEDLPRDFAPFNVQAIGANIYVTYAQQDGAKHDPVGGAGLGFVDVFSQEGRLLARLQHGSFLNAPWGLVAAPQDFGEFSNTLLVGNFRGDTIEAYNPVTGKHLGTVLNADGSTLKISGLWALRFGHGNPNSGAATVLYFTAGPDNEKNGLFGTLTPVAAELNEADEQ